MTKPALCVVIHDVAEPTWPACRRVMQAVREVADVPLTLLAVPRFHHQASTPAFDAWLGAREHSGDELALHGWSHVDDGTPSGWWDRLRRQHYTRGEGEFWALTKVEATERLAHGQIWFERNGWKLRGFVAPAWLLGPGAWAALDESPIAYTSTLRHIHWLHGGGRTTSQSIVYSASSAWRRASSVMWNAMVARSEHANPLMRIELHPRDADWAPVKRSWQRVLERALKERQATTVASLAPALAPVSLLPLRLAGEGRGEGLRKLSSSRESRSPAPSPQPSPAAERARENTDGGDSRDVRKTGS